MTSIKPPYLLKGDKVAIVAPAGKVLQEKIKYSIDIISSWGLQIEKGKNLFTEYGYFAGTDEQRLHDLQQMIDDPEIKAIFCMRGGYGITRIIDEISLEKMANSPKWIIGFSDITALHLKLARHDIESIHGIMPVNFDPVKAPYSIENLRQFLFGKVDSLEYNFHPMNKEGNAEGKLMGGNLSILADSMGTISALKGEDMILFFEEVDEYLYKIDRMLVQLKRNGIFENLKGLLVGHFSTIKDTKVPFGSSLEKIILEKVEGQNIPVAFGLPAGHDFPNLALPHNRRVSLEVNDKMTIIKF